MRQTPTYALEMETVLERACAIVLRDTLVTRAHYLSVLASTKPIQLYVTDTEHVFHQTLAYASPDIMSQNAANIFVIMCCIAIHLCALQKGNA